MTNLHHFATNQWVPFPVEAVFAFFADPLNLPLLMPPHLKTRIDQFHLQPPPAPDKITYMDAAQRVAGVGSEIFISFRPLPFLPVRQHWLARITEFEWNSHFCDEQICGPFEQFLHRHGTQAEVHRGHEGTLVTDDITFALPFGPVSALAAPLIRRMLDRSFAQRHERLQQLLHSWNPLG